MNEKVDKFSDPEWLRNLPLRFEEIGYSPDELTECPKCGKPNAPNRAACLYCGTELINTRSKRIELDEVESWENGFNVIATVSNEIQVERTVRELTATLRLEHQILERLLGSGKALPIARVSTGDTAAAISELLVTHGIETQTVRDADLLLDAPPRRLRSIEFGDDNLLLHPFSGGESIKLHRNDVAVIVWCVLLTEQLESTEQKKRRSVTTVSETQTSSDHLVLDVYSRADPTGWRVPISGFDFSSLGEHKSLLAQENIKCLGERISSSAPAARLVDDYRSVRPILEVCWPSEHRKDTQSSSLVTLGRNKKTRVFTTDNTTQVTKYSRLQWHLL
ncbi:MAG TPA: zinc ribbon domain-containing protein [Pyrinomonadaceae bacterium]